MAVQLSSTAANAGAVSSFTMSLAEGWDEIPGNGPPSVGDLVVLEVIEPKGCVTGPPGWTVGEDGRVFWRVIGPRECDPVFHAVAPDGWEVQGAAFSGLVPLSGAGSAVQWTG
jgi:hypothetical protein